MFGGLLCGVYQYQGPTFFYFAIDEFKIRFLYQGLVFIDYTRGIGIGTVFSIQFYPRDQYSGHTFRYSMLVGIRCH